MLVPQGSGEVHSHACARSLANDMPGHSGSELNVLYGSPDAYGPSRQLPRFPGCASPGVQGASPGVQRCRPRCAWKRHIRLTPHAAKIQGPRRAPRIQNRVLVENASMVRSPAWIVGSMRRSAPDRRDCAKVRSRIACYAAGCTSCAKAYRAYTCRPEPSLLGKLSPGCGVSGEFPCGIAPRRRSMRVVRNLHTAHFLRISMPLERASAAGRRA